jgi:hypothetical protein
MAGTFLDLRHFHPWDVAPGAAAIIPCPTGQIWPGLTAIVSELRPPTKFTV